MRRYVAETLYYCEEDRRKILQVVTVFPEEVNKNIFENEIGRRATRKGILRRNNKKWRYKEL
jgi:hypothetical protein